MRVQMLDGSVMNRGSPEALAGRQLIEHRYQSGIQAVSKYFHLSHAITAHSYESICDELCTIEVYLLHYLVW